MKTSMKTKYDIIIVGAGPSGVFCAYEIKKNAPYISGWLRKVHYFFD